MTDEWWYTESKGEPQNNREVKARTLQKEGRKVIGKWRKRKERERRTFVSIPSILG
jgi:hypothetical protein